MAKEKYKIIRCPKCYVPFMRIYLDGRQSILKWHEGRMHETFIKGIREIECFNCKQKIHIR